MQIQFDDIQKGDLIKVTFAFDDMVSTFTGIAHTLQPDTGRWVTSTNKGLVIRGATHATIELLERTAPTPELPTEPGSVIMDVVSINDVKYGTMFLDYQGDWEASLIPDKSSFRWLLPSEIKSFRLAKVVPADD